jgi:hypothetical protein
MLSIRAETQLSIPEKCPLLFIFDFNGNFNVETNFC